MGYLEERWIIEKNVPIPKPKGYTTTFPWPNMEVNDSVFFIFKNQNKDSSLPLYHNQETPIRSSAHVYGTKNKKKFVTRVLTENGKIGLRVWRVE